MARNDAQMAHDEAAKARQVSEETRADLEKLLNDIRDFLEVKGAKPSDIEAVRDKLSYSELDLSYY